MEKTAFLVLGAQRSGTSATSHVLSQLGVEFGDRSRFIQFDHNPIFFELDWINDYNNQIIQKLGYKYTDFFLPIESDFEQIDPIAIEAKLQEYLRSQWQSSCIGLKDPRFSLTFPIWQRVFDREDYQIQIIFVFRHPAGFLASNQRLCSNWKKWTAATHLRFWLQLNLAAVYLTRSHPVFYVNYDRLLQNPQAEVTQIADFFKFDRANIPSALQVIQPNAAHHPATEATGDRWVDRCYQLLCEQALTADEYLQFRADTNSV